MTAPRKLRPSFEKFDHLEHFRGDGWAVRLAALLIWKLPLILTGMGAALCVIVKWLG